jgi:hypothetical protein
LEEDPTSSDLPERIISVTPSKKEKKLKSHLNLITPQHKEKKRYEGFDKRLSKGEPTANIISSLIKDEHIP